MSRIMKIIIAVIFFNTVMTANDFEYNFILSLFRHHTNDPHDYYNNKASLKGLELKKGNDALSLIHMNNSFGNNSFGLMYNRYIPIKKKLNFIIGAGVVSGYRETKIKESDFKKFKEENPRLEYCYYIQPTTMINDDLAFTVSIGLEYEINDRITITTVKNSTAIVVLFKLKLKNN